MTWFKGASISVESNELVRLVDLPIANFRISGLLTIICGEQFSQYNFLLFTKNAEQYREKDLM